MNYLSNIKIMENVNKISSDNINKATAGMTDRFKKQGINNQHVTKMLDTISQELANVDFSTGDMITKIFSVAQKVADDIKNDTKNDTKNDMTVDQVVTEIRDSLKKMDDPEYNELEKIINSYSENMTKSKEDLEKMINGDSVNMTKSKEDSENNTNQIPVDLNKNSKVIYQLVDGHFKIMLQKCPEKMVEFDS